MHRHPPTHTLTHKDKGRQHLCTSSWHFLERGQMKDLPLWSFFSLTMCRPPMAICFQMELPATSHPRADWRLDSHTSLEQYPIKAQASLHLFCILLATKASLCFSVWALFFSSTRLLSVHLPPCCPHSQCKSPSKESIWLHYNWFPSTHSKTISAAASRFGRQIPAK